MVALVTLLLCLAAYLIGSIPTGMLVAQAAGVDLRSVGSGNIGATNASRALGRRRGLLVLGGDLLKGLLPVLFARTLHLPPSSLALVGVAAFLGHLFSLYLRFRGGKGVATGAGVFLALAPLPTLLALALFGLLVYRFRMVSLGSLGAALALPLLLILFGAESAYRAAAVVVLALILWKHRTNLVRLVLGQEPRLD